MKNANFRHGFTLTELLITAVMASIVLLAMTIILFMGHRSLNYAYNRSKMRADAYAAQLAFETAVRHASIKRTLPLSDTSLVLYGYETPTSVQLDHYVRFTYNATKKTLSTDSGHLEFSLAGVPSFTSSASALLASNVTYCNFYTPPSPSRAVEMRLVLDNTNESSSLYKTGGALQQKMVVTFSSTRHNE